MHHPCMPIMLGRVGKGGVVLDEAHVPGRHTLRHSTVSATAYATLELHNEAAYKSDKTWVREIDSRALYPMCAPMLHMY